MSFTDTPIYLNSNFISSYRYPSLKLKYILDFAEEFQKPVFAGRTGYQKRRQNAPFRITDEDVRENVKV